MRFTGSQPQETQTPLERICVYNARLTISRRHIKRNVVHCIRGFNTLDVTLKSHGAKSGTNSCYPFMPLGRVLKGVVLLSLCTLRNLAPGKGVEGCCLVCPFRGANISNNCAPTSLSNLQAQSARLSENSHLTAQGMGRTLTCWHEGEGL
jgi:hypothetical protein